jgi:hypothetical protein
MIEVINPSTARRLDDGSGITPTTTLSMPASSEISNVTAALDKLLLPAHTARGTVANIVGTFFISL